MRLPFSSAQRRDRAVRRLQLLANLHLVQIEDLPLASKIVDGEAAPGAPNLDIEMETGTGKTYVYIKNDDRGVEQSLRFVEKFVVGLAVHHDPRG